MLLVAWAQIWLAPRNKTRGPFLQLPGLSHSLAAAAHLSQVRVLLAPWQGQPEHSGCDDADRVRDGTAHREHVLLAGRGVAHAFNGAKHRRRVAVAWVQESPYSAGMTVSYCSCSVSRLVLMPISLSPSLSLSVSRSFDSLTLDLFAFLDRSRAFRGLGRGRLVL